MQVVDLLHYCLQFNTLLVIWWQFLHLNKLNNSNNRKMLQKMTLLGVAKKVRFFFFKVVKHRNRNNFGTSRVDKASKRTFVLLLWCSNSCCYWAMGACWTVFGACNMPSSTKSIGYRGWSIQKVYFDRVNSWSNSAWKESSRLSITKYPEVNHQNGHSVCYYKF